MSKQRLVRVCRTFARRGQLGYLPQSPATGWRYVKAGLLPSPVSIGPNSRAFICSELDAVMSARIAGADDSSIRRLVNDLESRRANRDEAASDLEPRRITLEGGK